MEKTKRRHILFDHPYLGAAVAAALGFVIIPIFGVLPSSVLEAVLKHYAAPEAADGIKALASNVENYTTILIAFLALLLHRLWFLRDGYKGALTRSPYAKKEVLLLFAAGIGLDLALVVVSMIYDGFLPILPSISTLGIALCAGAYEEISLRAIPIAIMLKNNPDRKRMWAAVFGSAIVFGLVHMGNMDVGAGFSAALLQSASAALAGVFYAALYIRTGNILFSILFHALEDVIALMDPAQVTGVITQTTFQVTDVLVILGVGAVMACAGIFLLRKSKWEEIQSNWTRIWNE